MQTDRHAMTVERSLRTLHSKLAWPYLRYLLLGLILFSACSSDGEPIEPSIDAVEAIQRIDSVLAYVESPEITVNTYTTTFNGFQHILIEGTHGFVPEGEELPGLLDARDALAEGDEQGFCRATALILKGSLINRVMDYDARDAVEIDEVDRQIDPERIFLDGSGSLRGMGNSFGVNPNIEFQTDVASEIWKSVTVELIGLLYDLGENCIEAAKNAANQLTSRLPNRQRGR